MQKIETLTSSKTVPSSGKSSVNPKVRVFNAKTTAAHKEAQDIMSGKKKTESYSSAEEFLEDLKAWTVREPKRTGQFKKDYKLMVKRRKDMSKIDEAITILINGGILPPEYLE